MSAIFRSTLGLALNDYDDILVSLRRITRAIDLQSKRLQKAAGLTTSQLLVMQAIDKLGSPPPSAIAKEVVLSQATITNILDRLETHGLVKRSRTSEDRRLVRIDLTDVGQEKLVDAPELLQAGFLKEYRQLPDWQRNMLIASLQHIAHMMDAEDLDASPILVLGEVDSHP
jgi:DNA-binding MarR family transcriptional regulator